MRSLVAVSWPVLFVAACAVPSESVVADDVKGTHHLGDLELIPNTYPEDGGAYHYTSSMGPPSGTPTLWKVPVAVGDAACLDFSTPAFYVRAAPETSPHRDDWIFFIPGGGSVQLFDPILEKWFGGDHGEMSTRWAPPEIAARGIFRTADNPFADFNMVFIHKCSSDRFMGRKASSVLVTRADREIHGVIPGTMVG